MSTCVILAAGKGTRMRSPLPKVLHPLGGRTLINHVIAAVSIMDPDPIIVTGSQADLVEADIKKSHQGCHFVRQEPQLGTGHAVAQALNHIPNDDSPVLILFGDTPLINTKTLENLVSLVSKETPLAVLTFTPDDAGRYGRVIIQDGAVERIREAKDATQEELACQLCNAGVMAATGRILHDLLPLLSDQNAAGEYYLTDLVALVRGKKLKVGFASAEAYEVAGVNAQMELAVLEAYYQQMRRKELMDQGVCMPHPETVFVSYDTSLAPGTLVESHCVFASGVKAVGPVHIRAFSHLEGVQLQAGCVVGPYARIRPGSELDTDVRIGNFVEVKKTKVSSGAKINHLSYIGDASVGAKANIGAGTITCNYDGYQKYQTVIGEQAFIGSNTLLIAPVNVGARAYTGSGTVVGQDVPEGALAVTRAQWKLREGWSEAFQQRKSHKGDDV